MCLYGVKYVSGLRAGDVCGLTEY